MQSLEFAGFEPVEVEREGVTVRGVRGGSGPAVLLLHGYPQTRLIWRLVAGPLAREFTVVLADLRGYGESDKPFGEEDHSTYSKRAMADDMVELMRSLGHERFAVVGHDRGARVAHRMCLDHPERVERAAVLDIVPTDTMYEATDRGFAQDTYHWFFLTQPYDLPERLFEGAGDYYVRETIRRWAGRPEMFSQEVMDSYARAFADPAAIHAACEDYRAGIGIDLEHHAADRAARIACPLLVLWGERGALPRRFDVLKVWRERAGDVSGHSVDSGHFLPEEAPEETLAALRTFLK
ncbi:alpha/beta fold hydrolase [Spirillospora sp. CA-253888]